MHCAPASMPMKEKRPLLNDNHSFGLLPLRTNVRKGSSNHTAVPRVLALVLGIALLACSSRSPSRTGTAEVATDDALVAEAPKPSEPEPSFWGPAPNLEKRLEVFEAVIADIDATYVFAATDIDWPSLQESLRSRVEGAAAYGEYFRIFTDLSRALGDAHNTFHSARVCNASLKKRPPFLRGFTRASRDGPSTLGFCGTAIDDDSVLVYRVHEKNGADLKPGDRIVGFDGKGLRPLLSEALATLPYCGATAGNAKADDLLMITSMAYNPHLYQSMDVIRGQQDKVESVATSLLLEEATPALICSEQLAIGVPFPWKSMDDVTTQSPVSAGVLPGTNIGYIYIYGWTGDVETALLEAIRSLRKTRGLIIDTRLNIGGNMFASYPTLRFLFAEDFTARSQIALRADPKTQELNLVDPAVIKVDSKTHYNHPIAILTGPLAGSSGDGATHLLASHPRARRFGRPTNGSPCFSGIGKTHGLGFFLGSLRVTTTPCTGLDDKKRPLSESAVAPEVSVWLTTEDVIAGRDTVVDKARAWIAEENARAAN